MVMKIVVFDEKVRCQHESQRLQLRKQTCEELLKKRRLNRDSSLMKNNNKKKIVVRTNNNFL